MAVKISYSTIVLICLFGYVHIANTANYCQYFQDDQSKPLMKWCPDTCCYVRPRKENETCCNFPSVDVAQTSTFTIFGYSWWRIFLVITCLFTAISILIHYTKRIHFLKHFKHFNAVVTPPGAFTISKSSLDLHDQAITLEENPPSYSTSVSPSPPPYATVHPSTIKILE